MKRLRLNKVDRERAILDAATSVAERIGYRNMTRGAVAAEAECSTGLVSWYYHTIEQLRQDVLKRAVADENPAILLQAMLTRDGAIIDLPPSARQRLVDIVCSDLKV